MNDFFQEAPVLGNQYEDDRVLRAYLRWKLPSAVLAEIEPDLRRLGERAAGDILELGNAAERDPPRHIPYDPWGRRVDRIELPDAWKQLDRISAEEGLVATAYERRHGALSRIHQFALLHLFGPSSAIYTCPLAMGDGAARVLELHGDDWLKEHALRRLTARDPEIYWTSGQWMTERTGGSDIGGTSTVARFEDGRYRLHGSKWFTSAATSQMALTLARIEDAPAGSRGLSLFFVELRDESGALRNIQINRLKDKLGTRALPTAELTLNGTPARLVGGEGQGVRKIAALLNVTRAYNASSAASFMRRGIALARDYARKRQAFGKRLADLPAHRETLAELQVEYEGAFHLAFRVAELIGKEEVGTATDQERGVLRLLTPVVKLYTAKQAIALASEVLETFGGAGYVEDTGLPRLLRDAQVLSIWEGTTNVLCLDALRAIERDDALLPFLADVRGRLDKLGKGSDPFSSTSAIKRVREAVGRIQAFWERGRREGTEFLQVGARGFGYSLARTYAASLLLEHADWLLQTKEDALGTHVAMRWCAQELTPLISPEELHRTASAELAMDEPAASPQIVAPG